MAQLQEKVKHVSEELIQSHMNLSTDQLTRELQETVQRRLSTQAVLAQAANGFNEHGSDIVRQDAETAKSRHSLNMFDAS